MRRLVLFDVDGTLISTRGRAGGALGRALNDVFGTAGPIETYPFAGKTDPQIVFELMGAAGLGRDAVAPDSMRCWSATWSSLATRSETAQ